MKLIIAAFLYLLGYFISYSMLRIEHEAGQQPYTKGNRLVNITFSLASWIMIMITLVNCWVKTIGLTGYWSAPVKQTPVKSEK